MSKMAARSFLDWEYTLSNLKDYLHRNLNHIKSIRIVHRCNNCFKKITDITLSFENGNLHVYNWLFNCNNGIESSHQFVIPHFNLENSLFYLEKSDSSLQLNMKFHMGSTLTIPFSSYYHKSDFGYGNNETELCLFEKTRKDTKFIFLQQFIDFYGLKPKYSSTIQLNFL